MTRIMPNRSKRKGVLLETLRAIRHYERVLYIKVTVRKSTTKAPTARVLYEVSRLGWYLVSRIVHGNPSGHSP